MEQTFQIKGYNYIQKVVSKASPTAGAIFTPKGWVGKTVAVILLEELNNDTNKDR